MARSPRQASIRRMIFHASRPRVRPLLALAAIAILGLASAGCTRSEASDGSPRVISPGMAESEGHELLFTESRIYTWADSR